MQTARPTTLAFNGMVATSHYLATEAGLQALRDGGSAADAVIAANAVLTVVYPDQTSIGGDCFLLYHEAATGTLHALNGSGRTPRAASAGAIRTSGHQEMPVRGIHAVTVPGTVDAWSQISERFGRLGLDRLLQPAIGYARDGFPVSPRLAGGIARAAEMLGADPYASSVYLPGGSAPKAGDRLVLADLAHSLEAVAAKGRAVYYDGVIAERIVAASAALGGAFTGEDLSSHRGQWVDPIEIDYRGVTVAGMPPNSQGMTALLSLNLAKQVSLGDWGTSAHLHPLIEAKKRAFSVRDARLGDPEFAAIDVDHLLSDAYARELWADYDPARASGGGPAAHGDTVYLCAVDRDGNAASMIQSILHGLRVGHRRAGDGDRAPEPGSILPAGGGPPELLRRREAHPAHPDAGDALPRRRAVGSDRHPGRRRPGPGASPTRHRPGRLRHGTARGDRSATLGGGRRTERPADPGDGRRRYLPPKPGKALRTLGHVVEGTTASIPNSATPK